MGNDKALIQRIELGKDNFDAEVKYSTTYMVDRCCIYLSQCCGLCEGLMVYMKMKIV